jgi:hypothetical protein
MQTKCRNSIWALFTRAFGFDDDVRRLAADAVPSVLRFPSAINVEHYYRFIALYLLMMQLFLKQLQRILIFFLDITQSPVLFKTTHNFAVFFRELFRLVS